MVTGLSRLTKVTALEILRSMFDIAMYIARPALTRDTTQAKHKLTGLSLGYQSELNAHHALTSVSKCILRRSRDDMCHRSSSRAFHIRRTGQKSACARCDRRAAERRGMRCCLSALVPYYEETCMCPHGAGEPPLPGTPLVDNLSWRAHAGSSMGASMPFCLALM